VRAQLPVPPPADQLLDVLTVTLGLTADECAPEDADDVAALEQREIRAFRSSVA
jgi:hypothetical protein